MKFVYADVVLASNFCFDYLLFLMTSSFLGVFVLLKRRILASVSGAFFALLTAVFIYSAKLSLMLSLLFVPILCRICFGKQSFLMNIRIYITLLMFGILLGGLSMLVVNTFYDLKNSEVPMFFISFVCAFVLIGLFKYMGQFFFENINCRRAKVKIISDEMNKEYIMLCDSASFLFDPYVKMPMIMLRRREKSNILGSKPLRIVPYKTASGHGFAEAFTPDEVYVEGKIVRASICFVSDENISSLCGDGILPKILVS